MCHNGFLTLKKYKKVGKSYVSTYIQASIGIFHHVLKDQTAKKEQIVVLMFLMFSLFYIKKKIKDLFNF